MRYWIQLGNLQTKIIFFFIIILSFIRPELTYLINLLSNLYVFLWLI